MPRREAARRAAPVWLIRPWLIGLWLIGLAGCSALGPNDMGADPAPTVRGPVASVPQHPVALTYFFPRQRRPVALEQGKVGFAVDAAYSSLFMTEREGMDEVVLDGEILHTTARFRAGLGGRTDVEIELPFLYTTSGFLDHFVESFHDAFELPEGNRDARPEDQYEMQWTADGERVWELEEDRFGLLDIPITITHVLLPETASRPALAVRGGVQLPTGSESRGFSNGAPDWLIGVLLEQSLGRWTLSAAGDWSIVDSDGNYTGSGGFDDDLWDVQLGVEYRWNDRVSLLSQVVLFSPLEPDIDMKQTADPILDLGLGCAWDTGERSRLALTFHEDLVSEAGPDFSLQVGWVYGM